MVVLMSKVTLACRARTATNEDSTVLDWAQRVGLRRSFVTATFLAAMSIAPATPASIRGLEQANQIDIIEIFAERFSFTPSEIHVQAGATIELRVRSDDTNHGFRIIGTDVNVLVPKRGRGTATVRFRPEKPGRYIFECSKLCGAGHSFMRGALVVME